MESGISYDNGTESKPEGPSVTMYVTSWCPSVRLARRYLDRLGIQYTEVDIDRTPTAARQLEEWTGGYRTVPTFDIDGQIVIDFNMRELNKALGL